MRIFASPDELLDAAGTHLGYSPWRTVEQERVTAFAEVTGDLQWIHIDPERAAAGPYGTTIAHGYFVLSLLPSFAAEVYRVESARMAVNYGLGKVRFPAPVPVGSSIRAGIELVSAGQAGDAVHTVALVTVEREGGEKPCCVAETIARFYA
ncbi:MaoC family dehydratase [Rugosimonospora africana]|uniref:MaoC family dehydratase n=1 Tax=Rugosimonospora africana TaxID=556532 RepID=A0A8J3QTG4_9ACTN|nr:MaoC family dehydratase [Rugosimonospora africana]GIH14571.1 MaoC family dehydratase [Rugosimonospora africana]